MDKSKICIKMFYIKLSVPYLNAKFPLHAVHAFDFMFI